MFEADKIIAWHRVWYRAAPAVLAILLLLASLPSNALADWQRQQRDIMGTRISVELWHAEQTVAEECSSRVFAEMDRINLLMSSYLDNSELSYINHNAATAKVDISDELRHLIQRSIYFSEISHGAFDITYASVGYTYDYRKQQQPDNQLVAQKLAAIDYRHIELDDHGIHFNNPAVRIDLGGIANYQHLFLNRNKGLKLF